MFCVTKLNQHNTKYYGTITKVSVLLFHDFKILSIRQAKITRHICVTTIVIINAVYESIHVSYLFL